MGIRQLLIGLTIVVTTGAIALGVLSVGGADGSGSRPAARPAGLTAFASDGPVSLRWQPVEGATSYTARSGAHIFATGTNHWSRGLGHNMAGAGETDVRLRQARLIALSDMGARAETPARDLVVDRSPEG